MLAVDALETAADPITYLAPAMDTVDAALNASLLLVSTCEDTTKMLLDATVAAINATRTPSTSIELALATATWPMASRRPAAAALLSDATSKAAKVMP